MADERTAKDRDKIRILIADDSYLWAATISEVLDGDSDLEVVGRVTDGRQAIEAVERLRPDLVLMDVHMPVLGGLEAISVIMSHHPTPILVMTGDPAGKSGELSFDALRRGALDLLVKDTTYPPDLGFVAGLRRKVKALAEVQVVRHVDSRGRRPRAKARGVDFTQRIRAVAIVASTGGPSALATVLKDLPRDFAAGIAIVQHLTSEFAPIFTSWLDDLCSLRVTLARDGEPLAPGRALVAPADRHLVVRAAAKTSHQGTVRLQEGLDRETHRPSGNLLLSSVASAYGPAALGLVMTGMGDDGTHGLLELRQAGGTALAQDEASSAVFGMPRAAGAAGAVQRFVPLGEIADVLSRAVGRL